MTLGNRLRDARKRNGYTQKQLAEKIGAKHNSVSNWENGLNAPDPATIECICEILSVTPNFLLLGEEIPAISRGDFTSAEISLLGKYRRLDKHSQGAIDALLDYYCGLVGKVIELPTREQPEPIREVAQNSVTHNPSATVINGRISSQSVAAGTGTYLDHDLFDTISVEQNDLTRRAAFYVPVSGNSMEPKYHDGDILIIQQTTVKVGEIGIFTLDGSGFVKIRGTDELISLNPDYAPIPMNDDIVCNGKVIGTLEPEWIVPVH